MRKTSVLILAAGALLALAACGGKNATSSAAGSSAPVSTSAPASSSSAPASSSETPASSSGTPTSSSSSSPTSSSSSETIKTIGSVTASGTYDLKGVVACVTTAGYVLDDGTGAIYVYQALESGYKVGDYVAINLTVAPYFSIWEGTKVNSIAKAEGTAPTLATPVALTGAVADSWKNMAGAKDEETAPVTTASVVPLSLTATAQVDSNGFTYFNAEGSTLPLEPSKLSEDITLFTGVKYDLVFYFGGYNSSKALASIYVKSAAPKYEAVTGVTVSGGTSVMVGESLQLKAVVAPTGANPSVTWATSDEKIATVSETGLVRGVAAGSATITVTSVADTTKSATVALSVEANTTKLQAAFDLSKIPAVATSATVTGAMDDAATLALFTGTTYLTSGTNTITAATTTKIYGNDPTQGPKKTGLKFGSSKAGGKLVLTSSVDLVKVKFTVYAWTAKSLSSVTINGTTTALVAADATTAKVLSATFDAAKTVTIETTARIVAVGIEFFIANA